MPVLILYIILTSPLWGGALALLYLVFSAL